MVARHDWLAMGSHPKEIPRLHDFFACVHRNSVQCFLPFGFVTWQNLYKEAIISALNIPPTPSFLSVFFSSPLSPLFASISS
jgi:hypothetical protein